MILDEDAIARFRSAYRATFGAAGLDDPLYEAVSVGRKQQGMEHWLPFFHDRMETLFDYLPGAPVALDHQIEEAREVRAEMIRDHYRARADAAKERPSMGASVYKPAPPELLYLDEAGWKAALAGRPVRRFSPLPQPPGPDCVDAGGRIGRSFAAERQQEGVNLFNALADHLRKLLKAKKKVIFATYSEGARDRVKTLLEDHEAPASRLISRFAEAKAGLVNLAVWPLEQGFETEGLAVVAEQDVLGDRLVRAPRRRKRGENFLTEAASLSAGDLVVHVEHGIGRFLGLETVQALGAPHDCAMLEYAGGDKLYLPVENIELLSRYGQDAGLLDKLGGGAWQARKARMKERIREMADRLIRLAAERALRKAPEFEPPQGSWDEFCARFPYTETDDQLSAIADVLDDLAAGQPMDRLICGDVGFGKTEVALRAAFAASMSGMQVAVVAPTTLLARQHAKTFEERFRGFPVHVRQLSRFTPAKEAADTRKRLTDGTVDIVIGTHSLLAQGIRFKDLGLLIIDEEQHFGVRHKERLKELRSDVHVLTMTATPIPRTLQLAMSGVRELSVIATPPVDRLAVRSYITEFDPVTVREALLRERFRGGQSFFVVPRISDLPEIEEFLREDVPEVSYVIANGQMAAGELDDRMNAFYDGRYDVLLATTIVESGLDIPRGQHADRAPGGHVRAGAALPDPGARGAVQGPRLRLFHHRAAQADDRRRGEAAEGAGEPRQPRGGVHAGLPRPGHPRCGQPDRRGAVRPYPRGGVRALPAHAGGGDPAHEVRRHGRAGDAGGLVAEHQSRRAGDDPRGICAGPRRAAGALSPAVVAGDEDRAGGLRGRAA